MSDAFDGLLSAVESHDLKDQARTKPKFALMDFRDVMDDEIPQWLVTDVFIEKQLGVLYGPPDVGKSFLALDWALTIAHGDREWLDRYPVKHGNIAYIAGEGRGGLKVRYQAWTERYGDVKHRALLQPQSFDMMDLAEVIAWCTEVEVRLEGKPLRLVVIDTMARAMYMGDENSTQDVSRFVENCAEIQRRLDCAVLIVHHPDKQGKYERGSTALRGAVDMMVAMVERPEGLLLMSVKQKDAVKFPHIHMRLEVSPPAALIMPPLLMRYTREEE